MIYVSLNYYLFLAALIAVYYLLPLKYRWLALLAGSVGFYLRLTASPLVFLVSAAVSWLAGLGLGRPARGGTHEAPEDRRLPKKLLLGLGVTAALAPLVMVKLSLGLAAPLGLSFYTLQIIAYLADVYRGDIPPEGNPLRYLLFVSFFPQILQGPIPRYARLAPQLYEGHRFDEEGFTKGLLYILWGFFLKFMIADKAAVAVDAVFNGFPTYQGCYVLAAGVLYSLQLYADFLSCVKLSQGAAALFGVELAENFDHPYRSRSIKEFWRRWHISLSSWLRDYVYIPLGGSRRGALVKYVNLVIVFAVSGVWHGTGWRFLAWGLLHAAYQIAGSLTARGKDRVYDLLKMPRDSLARTVLQTAGTFLWVMLAWIVFRAPSFLTALAMLRSLFTVYNPWVLFDGSLTALGLEGAEWALLLLSSLTLWAVGHWHQSRGSVRTWLLEQHLVVRWFVYIAAVCLIWICGTYGFGFGQDFIYGGF